MKVISIGSDSSEVSNMADEEDSEDDIIQDPIDPFNDDEMISTPGLDEQAYYQSKDECRGAVRAYAASQGFAAVIRRSKRKKPTKTHKEGRELIQYSCIFGDDRKMEELYPGQKYARAISYIRGLDEIKERFVHASINKQFHSGQTGNSRLEGQHATLKKSIDTKYGDLLLVIGPLST